VAPAQDADRNLLERVAAGDSLDQKLGGMEPRLAQVELGQQVGANRAEAVRAVRHVRSGEHAHEPVEPRDPQFASKRAGLRAADDARSLHQLSAPAEHRRDDPCEVVWPVLTVGIHRDHEASTGENHQGVPGHQRRAATAVLR